MPRPGDSLSTKSTIFYLTIVLVAAPICAHAQSQLEKLKFRILPGDYLTQVTPVGGFLRKLPAAGERYRGSPQFSPVEMSGPDGYAKLEQYMGHPYGLAAISSEQFQSIQTSVSERVQSINAALSHFELPTTVDNEQPSRLTASSDPKRSKLLALTQQALSSYVEARDYSRFIVALNNPADEVIDKWVAEISIRDENKNDTVSIKGAIKEVLVWRHRQRSFPLIRPHALRSQGYSANSLNLISGSGANAKINIEIPRSFGWSKCGGNSELDVLKAYWTNIDVVSSLSLSDKAFLQRLNETTGGASPGAVASEADYTAIVKKLTDELNAAIQSGYANCLLAEVLSSIYYDPSFLIHMKSGATGGFESIVSSAAAKIKSTNSKYIGVDIPADTIAKGAAILVASHRFGAKWSASRGASGWVVNQLRPSLTYEGSYLKSFEEISRVMASWNGIDINVIVPVFTLLNEPMPLGLNNFNYEYGRSVPPDVLVEAMSPKKTIGYSETSDAFARLQAIHGRAAASVSQLLFRGSNRAEVDELRSASSSLDQYSASMFVDLAQEGERLIAERDQLLQSAIDLQGSFRFGVFQTPDDVTIVNVLKKPGQYVEKGDALFTFLPDFVREFLISLPASAAATISPGAEFKSRVSCPKEKITPSDKFIEAYRTRTYFKITVLSVNWIGNGEQTTAQVRARIELPLANREIDLKSAWIREISPAVSAEEVVMKKGNSDVLKAIPLPIGATCEMRDVADF